MTRDGGSRSEYDAETIEEIDAEVDALSDEHVRWRLQEVLSRARARRNARLPSSDPTALGADAAEVDDLETTLRAMKLELRTVGAALSSAKARRDDLLRHLAAAEERVARARRRVAGILPGDDPYIATVLEVSQEILDDAHATAKRILSDANDRAECIILAAENGAALPSVRRANVDSSRA